MKRIYFLFLLIIHLAACGGNKAPDISKIQVDIKFIRFDQELEELKKDSVSVVGELSSFMESMDKVGLTKYDPKPMPFDVFNLKIQEVQNNLESIIYGRMAT